MLSTRETVTSLYGAYRLARFDAGGMAYFDATHGGFWRSFYAAVLIAPFYAVLFALRYMNESVESGSAHYALINVIAYVIAWLAFPVVMTAIVRVLDREQRFISYIVAYNWAAVLQNALYLPFAILRESGLVPDGTTGMLGLIILSVIMAYGWFITRTALEIPANTAAGVVVLDLILSLFVSLTAESLL